LQVLSGAMVKSDVYVMYTSQDTAIFLISSTKYLIKRNGNMHILQDTAFVICNSSAYEQCVLCKKSVQLHCILLHVKRASTKNIFTD